MALVECDGKASICHLAKVAANSFRPLIVTNVPRMCTLMADESGVYTADGKEFNGDQTMNHSVGGYVTTGSFKYNNTAENFFSTFKRGVMGTDYHFSVAHLSRYCAEFYFC